MRTTRRQRPGERPDRSPTTTMGAVLLIALASVFPVAARADVPPSGRAECLDRYIGEPCQEGEHHGVCAKLTCYRQVGTWPGDTTPPVAFECVRCAASLDAGASPQTGMTVMQRDSDEPARSVALAARVRREADEEAGRIGRRRMQIFAVTMAVLVAVGVMVAGRRRRGASLPKV